MFSTHSVNYITLQVCQGEEFCLFLYLFISSSSSSGFLSSSSFFFFFGCVACPQMPESCRQKTIAAQSVLDWQSRKVMTDCFPELVACVNSSQWLFNRSISQSQSVTTKPASVSLSAGNVTLTPAWRYGGKSRQRERHCGLKSAGWCIIAFSRNDPLSFTNARKCKNAANRQRERERDRQRERERQRQRGTETDRQRER